MVETLEKHHKVRILNEAVVDAVKLSSRYISGRQLPDKAVSLLDTTCARIGLSQSATPPASKTAGAGSSNCDVAIGILQREKRRGPITRSNWHELQQQQQAGRRTAEAAAGTAGSGKGTGGQIAAARHCIGELATRTAVPVRRGSRTGRQVVPRPEQPRPAASRRAPPAVQPLTDEQSAAASRTQLAAAEAQLAKVQGESARWCIPCVNAQAVAETVAAWTGIPVGRMVADEIKTVLNLKELMEQSIVGQSHALERIAQSIRTSRANLRDPAHAHRRVSAGGTSGVGKTETAITLAELLYGGEQNMTVINMSEFKEEHKVSLLMGSPPGYVGYGEGGVLTEAVRRKPYSVVLLDEMEKAHPGVQDIFYQVFDKGTMKDGEGRDIDFKNTVIMMTTNAGTDFIKSLCADPDTMPDPDGFVAAVFPELLKTFKPAFLGRLVDHPLLSAERRRDEEDHPAETGQDRQSRAGALQSRVLVCARIGRDDRPALHGSRHRGPECRPHPDADAAAGDVHRVSESIGGGANHPAGAHHHRP